MILPEIELDDLALARMIEANNAYALCEFRDPVNDIYTAMLMSVAGYIPQLLNIAATKRKL